MLLCMKVRSSSAVMSSEGKFGKFLTSTVCSFPLLSLLTLLNVLQRLSQWLHNSCKSSYLILSNTLAEFLFSDGFAFVRSWTATSHCILGDSRSLLTRFIWCRKSYHTTVQIRNRYHPTSSAKGFNLGQWICHFFPDLQQCFSYIRGLGLRSLYAVNTCWVLGGWWRCSIWTSCIYSV